MSQNLTILIPYFNGHKTIQRLLDSLPYDLPVIAIDDHSDLDKATIVYSTDCPTRNIKVIRPDNKGYFTGAVNRGVEACNTDVLILNQDTYFTGDKWLDVLDKADLVGESIQGKHPWWPQGYIHGTFMFISRRVIDRVGLLNEVDYPLWGSTCEYQLRACRQGFSALPLPSVPDFVHLREGRFGNSIQTILEREPERRQQFVDIPPKISVVTACHNYGRFLPDLVNSLIGGPTSLGQMAGQTFQSFELVIVDYGSTDNTPQIARNLANDWKAIRYIQTKDIGTAAAFNLAIKSAYGKYIAVIDADDMMESFRLEMLYRLQLEHPHSFVYDDLLLFANGERRVYGLIRPNRWDTVYPLGFRDAKGNQIDYDFEQLLKRNGISKAIMFPKVAWQEAGGYPETMKYGREDWAFNVALGLKGWCGVKAEKPGYLYRREGHNRTLRNTSPEWRQKFMSQMLELYPDVYRGVRPMGCCGGNKLQAARSNGSIPMITANLPGKDGFEILEYIGTNSGDMTWYGSESRARYTFGGNRRIGYVDKRDVAKMIALVDQGAKVFRVYQKPKSLDTQPLPKLVELPFDPSLATLAQIRSQVEGLSDEQLEALLEAEKTGLNRKGAIGTLEAALGNA